MKLHPLQKVAVNVGRRVADRLMDVSTDLAADPQVRGGLFSSQSSITPEIAQLATALGGATAEHLPGAVRSTARGVGGAVDAALQTGSEGLGAPVWGGINTVGQKFKTLPRMIVGGSILSVPFAADAAYLRGDTVAPLGRAQATGENLMTDPFTSFVQKRGSQKVASSRGAVFSGLAGGLASKAGPSIDNILMGLISKSKPGATDALRNISVPKALGLGALGVGAGASLDLMSGQDSVGSGLEYQLSKQFIPITDRIQATDTAASAFLTQGGKNMANLLDEAMREGINVGHGAATQHNRSFNQDLQFAAAMNTDPLLRDATKQDAAMLRQSFNSMSRFAPDLATDEFAVKNFLRESMLAANGPDYATLGNMARVNESIAPSTLLPQKTKAPI
jgi:hypothetical protein